MADKITVADILAFKQANRKITSVSCYDYTTGRLVADAGVEMILVGDSAAQVMLGHDSTLPATMDFMVTITAAVRRAAPKVCLVADMPFMSYHTGIGKAVENAGRFVVDSGADIIKVEATEAQLDVIKAISDSGMSVMAHIGIRPQSICKLGKFKAEGTNAELAYDLITLADKMVKAGASSLLLEGTSREVAGIITRRVPVPVISCGSGPDCDGQILIIADILGLTRGKAPKFAKSYADMSGQITTAISAYREDVTSGSFPDDDHCYHIKSGELEKLEQMIKGLS
jgi:3-methyl-2-oxobutanoate hydroxymethyltransferase